MYRVKLNNENTEKITVGGITITHRWKQINDKTKALEELEKKGIIKIEEIAKATRQSIEVSGEHMVNSPGNEIGAFTINPQSNLIGVQTAAIQGNVNGMLTVNSPGNEIGAFTINPQSNLIGAQTAAIQGNVNGMLTVNSPGNEIGAFTVNPQSNLIGAQTGIYQAMNELSSIKADFGALASSLETKKGTYIIEQKPISIEQVEMEKINDLEERISDVSTKLPKIIEKTVNEMFEKKFEEINKKSNTNKQDREKNITEKIEPKTEAKKSEIEKFHWQGTVEELIYLFKNLYDIGKLTQKRKNKLISDHFKKRDGTDITANAISTTYQKMKDNYPIIDKVLNNLKNFEKNYKS